MEQTQQKTKVTFQDWADEAYLQFTESVGLEKCNEFLAMADNVCNELNGMGITGKRFQEFTENEMSQMLGELAIIRDSLTYSIEVAKNALEIKRAFIKIKEQEERKSLKEKNEADGRKMNVDEINSIIKKQLAKHDLIFGFTEAHIDKLKSKWFSYESIMRAMEIRINVLTSGKSSGKRVNNYNHENVVSNFKINKDVGEYKIDETLTI